MIKMLFEQDNWLATLIAAVAYWVIGAIWYGILGKRWMTAAKLTKEQTQSNSRLVFLYTFVIEFVIVMGLSSIIGPEMPVKDAVQVGLVVGLIFGGFTTWIHYMYTNQNRDLYWIDAGYTTIASIVAAVILSVM